MGNLEYCDWCKHDKSDGYNTVKCDLSEGEKAYEHYDGICDKCAEGYRIFRDAMISSRIPQICYKEQDDG